MRWNLLKTYDKIYTIDLHGNSKKNETALDGSVDQNVFDIMQGVSINLFVKTGEKKKNELGKIFHYDLFGKRELKYDFLSNNNLKSINFKIIQNEEPMYYMVQKDFDLKKSYDKGFKIIDIFNLNSLGIQTHRDSLSINDNKELLSKKISAFYDLSIENEQLKSKYFINENSEWKLSEKRNGFFDKNKIIAISYRPFDDQYIYYDKGIVDRLRDNVSKHLIHNNNFCLIVSRQCVSDWRYVFISTNIIESNLTGTAGRFGSGNFFPLYLYPEKTEQQSLLNDKTRTPNLNMEIVNEIAKGLGLAFTPEKEDGNVCLANDKDVRSEFRTTFAPIDLLDYIYAVLHSPTYRETYKEFLKIDFPRVPYPHHVGAGRDVVGTGRDVEGTGRDVEGTGRDVEGTGRDLSVREIQENFWKLVALGGELRQIHLLESPIVEKYITQYPNDGNNVVGKIHFENNRVYINYDKASPLGIEGLQYFANVPEVAWNFYIGGYQPAQKWLKDRKDRELGFEDILHYQKIIVALSETDRIMKEIDKIEI